MTLIFGNKRNLFTKSHFYWQRRNEANLIQSRVQCYSFCWFLHINIHLFCMIRTTNLLFLLLVVYSNAFSNYKLCSLFLRGTVLNFYSEMLPLNLFRGSTLIIYCSHCCRKHRNVYVATVMFNYNRHFPSQYKLQ